MRSDLVLELLASRGVSELLPVRIPTDESVRCQYLHGWRPPKLAYSFTKAQVTCYSIFASVVFEFWDWREYATSIKLHLLDVLARACKKLVLQAASKGQLARFCHSCDILTTSRLLSSSRAS